MPLMFEFPHIGKAEAFLAEVRKRFPQHKAELTIQRSVAGHFLHTNGVWHTLHQPWVDVERKASFVNERELHDLAKEFGSIGSQT